MKSLNIIVNLDSYNNFIIAIRKYFLKLLFKVLFV